MSFWTILIEFARFAYWPLAPMLLAYPAWALHARQADKWRRRRQRLQRWWERTTRQRVRRGNECGAATSAARQRVRRGNPRRNPTARQ